MESAPSETKVKQERGLSCSIVGYEPVEVPELNELLRDAIPWDDIDPIILAYYQRFADNRQVSDLLNYIKERFGVVVTKSCIGKRYSRMREMESGNDRK